MYCRPNIRVQTGKIKLNGEVKNNCNQWRVIFIGPSLFYTVLIAFTGKGFVFGSSKNMPNDQKLCVLHVR